MSALMLDRFDGRLLPFFGIGCLVLVFGENEMEVIGYLLTQLRVGYQRRLFDGPAVLGRLGRKVHVVR
ncbi:hypothetical protein X748_27695 [Mesorhizobium sp. LNJC386A00]|nr:hypothetical protein X748_27695 [Mesorhizobium sp. LNJC386A00]